MQNAPIGAFCNTFDLNYATIGLEKQFVFFCEWPYYTGFTVYVLSWHMDDSAMLNHFILKQLHLKCLILFFMFLISISQYSSFEESWPGPEVYNYFSYSSQCSIKAILLLINR